MAVSTKDELLKLFESNKGEWFSGGEIGERLDISRTAIWKAVESLRADGYAIEAVKSKGYCLSPDTDIVSSQGVAKYLKKDLDVKVFEEVVSTNTLLKELASGGAGEGCVVIANSQTGGKGRMGRKFFSPSNSGVYISVLLRPNEMAPEKALKITTMAAVAAASVIEEVTGKEAKIKWVNDIFVDGKKAVGILTEASMSMESGNLEYAVLGIGFNVYLPEGGFPEELSDIAGALLDAKMPDAKNRIAAGFLNHFFEIYDDPEHLHYETCYKEKSLVLGKEVDVISALGERRALVLDITDDYNLVVRYDDGTEGILSSGEVRIRPLRGTK